MLKGKAEGRGNWGWGRGREDGRGWRKVGMEE